MGNFDPDKFLAERQVKTATAGSDQSFDPDKFMQERGIQTLPNNGDVPQVSDSLASKLAGPINTAAQVANYMTNPIGGYLENKLQQESQSPGAGQAAANGLGQGATYGFNDEAAAALSAAAPTGTDQALGRDYAARYATNRDALRKSIADTAVSHPITTAISELVGSLPLTIATGGAISTLGKGAAALANAAAAGTYGLGKSKKDTLSQTAKDVAVPAAMSLGLSALANTKPIIGFINDGYKKFVNAQTQQEAVDILNPKNVGVNVESRPNGDFSIKFESAPEKVATAYKLGRDEGKMLSSPDVQAKVQDEVNGIFGSDEQPGTIPTLIAATKQKLGVVRDGLIKDIGAVPVDAESPLKAVWDRVRTYDAGGDAEKEKALEHLKGLLTNGEMRMRATSPTASINDVPLSVTFQQVQDLGDQIFGRGDLYSKTPAVKSMARDLYFGLKRASDSADSTGQLKTLSDTFHALYSMDENSINGTSKLENLTNPLAGSARKAYGDFIAPFLKLDPNSRAALAPEMQEYLATEFPKTLNKMSIIKQIANTHDEKGGLGWLLNKIYLNKGTIYNSAGAAGIAAKNAPAVQQGLSTIAAPAAASPALNNLMAPTSGSGSLRSTQ